MPSSDWRPDAPDICFGTAHEAAALAGGRIADYPGRLRYHLFTEDFEHTAEGLQELVR